MGCQRGHTDAKEAVWLSDLCHTGEIGRTGDMFSHTVLRKVCMVEGMAVR